MRNKTLKKIGIILSTIVAVFYLLFLVLPFTLTPILNGYAPQISKTIEETSGFKVKLDGMQVITTPKLTAGIKINKIEALANNEKFFQADNFQTKLSILPLFTRKIEVDVIGADNINLNLKVQKDGKFLIEKYIPKTKEEVKETKNKPFFKLSNHLPNIYINNHEIVFSDMATNKNYSIEGSDTKVSDFILDKKVKLSGKGKMVLNGREQFVYDVKIFNKIMPNVQLNDLVFNPQPPAEKPEEIAFNIIDIFKALYSNGLCANLKADVKTFGNVDDVRLDGLINIDKLSVNVNQKKLPDSNIKLDLKGNKIALDSDVYTAENEITHIIGKFKTGKKPDIDMNFKSNANLKSIVEIAKSVAKSFDIKDLDTISANGIINADFNIKSDLKKIQSSGYFKVPSGNLKYGLYNISINNINSDISFDNNLINIKNIGFYVLGQPLKIYGTIKQDANADVHVVANKLSLKSILLSLGQISTLKENVFNSGTLTLDASLTGKLDNPNTLVNLSVDNLNLKNIPSASTIIMPNQSVQLKSNKKTFTGIATKSSLKIINPAATILVGKSTSIITPTEIIINPINVSIDKIKLIVSGKIKNYLTDKVVLDIKTDGNITSYLTGEIHPMSQKLNLNYSIPTPCTIPIPGFAGSKLQTKGDLAIYGSMLNPILKGTFKVPFVLLPDMLVSMSDMVVNLNGPFLKGYGTLAKLTSGEIVAKNLSADFNLKGNMFYIKNIIADAYSGKVKGNVDYNVVSGKIGADFVGSNMDATSAIAGAAGIKDTLSGTLGFNTKVTLKGMTYEEQVKTLKGGFSFKIEDGMLGKMGRLENFLNAQNILANTVLRTALNTIATLSTIKDTSSFKYIKGDMTFSNGWANISSIKISGNTMSYYVKGRSNILNGTTNVIVLGRLSSDVVALLGPIGDLSVDKLTSYIPKFGPLTAVIIRSMTTSPEKENIEDIPPLANGDKVYKDFKVVFNGGLESKSSVKSFKWLSNVDTSAIDIKSTIKDVKKQFTDVKKSTVEGVKKQYADVKSSTVNEVKSTVDETKKQLQNTKDEVLNLFKF